MSCRVARKQTRRWELMGKRVCEECELITGVEGGLGYCPCRARLRSPRLNWKRLTMSDELCPKGCGMPLLHTELRNEPNHANYSTWWHVKDGPECRALVEANKRIERMDNESIAQTNQIEKLGHMLCDAQDRACSLDGRLRDAQERIAELERAVADNLADAKQLAGAVTKVRSQMADLKKYQAEMAARPEADERGLYRKYTTIAARWSPNNLLHGGSLHYTTSSAKSDPLPDY